MTALALLVLQAIVGCLREARNSPGSARVRSQEAPDPLRAPDRGLQGAVAAPGVIRTNVWLLNDGQDTSVADTQFIYGSGILEPA